MGFMSVLSPISNKNVRDFVSPISNEHFRNFIKETTAIGNPTLQKLSLQFAAVAAPFFLPPGISQFVSRFCNDLSQNINDKQQHAQMASSLERMPADQQQVVGDFLKNFSKMMLNPDFQKQLQNFQNNADIQNMSTGNSAYASLKFPPVRA